MVSLNPADDMQIEGEPEIDVSRVMYTIRTEGISARGRADLIRFYSGRKMTPMQAIRAKCYDCMGYYADGRRDCCQIRCPLYRFMPYGSHATSDDVQDGDGEDDSGGDPAV